MTSGGVHAKGHRVRDDEDVGMGFGMVTTRVFIYYSSRDVVCQ